MQMCLYLPPGGKIFSMKKPIIVSQSVAVFLWHRVMIFNWMRYGGRPLDTNVGLIYSKRFLLLCFSGIYGGEGLS